MRQVLVLSSARSDLLQLQSYALEVWGAAQVIEFQELVDRAFTILAFSPFLGRKTNIDNIYALTLGKLPLIILYSVKGDFIYIKKVLHTKQAR